ncbi:MAG: maleylpyruvate isomerase N-terminal domain-containing protein [Dehalococcoidia bacterium]|nr:maleylpyruvate isomerase N-terminal domain-containing protein [Dehalococcoidia bacterium]
MDKSAAITQLEDAYTGFREQIADLPHEAYHETFLGEWNLNKLLAHMAGWFREMSGAIERVGKGERPTPEGVDYSDPEPWNARFAQQSKDGPAALDDWDNAFHQYYAAAKALDESFYGMDPEKGRPKVGNRLLDGAGVHHFAEHRPQIEEWLRSRA